MSIPQPQTVRKPLTTKSITVPPGKGRPSTHSRNQRRRLKKQIDTTTAPAALPEFVSAINATPVANAETERAKARQGRIHGPAPDVASALNKAFGGNERGGRLDPGTLAGSPLSASSSTLHTPLYPQSEAEETLNVQMLSMLPKSKNKNKSRRGAEEIDPRSRKIVFGTPPPAPGQPEEDEEARVLRPVLIPPSTLPGHLIPSNMFITCIDVEEGLKKPKKNKRRVEEATMDEPVTVLDYGEERPSLNVDALDLDTAPLITSHTDLTVGCIIGFEVGSFTTCLSFIK